MFIGLGFTYGGSYFLYEGHYRSSAYDVASISTLVREFIAAGIPETSIERRKDIHPGFQRLVITQSPEVDAVFARIIQKNREAWEQEHEKHIQQVQKWNEIAHFPYSDDLP